jgi:hypothetical protein
MPDTDEGANQRKGRISMTDPPIQTVLASPIFKTTKLIYPSAPPPFPPEFYPFVGIIALSWGIYESHFNRWLAAAIDATGDTSEPNWKFLDYRRRRKLARKLFIAHFTTIPGAQIYILKVLDDSAVIHNKRNAILHRKLAYRVYRTAPPKVDLVAETRLNRRIVMMTFTADELETLGYELMHLSGRLNLTFQNRVPGPSLDDMRALEALVSRIPPAQSILPTLSGQP